MKLYKGKTTCRILKDIRRQIAEENDIELVIKECTYQGDCLGTCPRCEAEVAYLEKELAKREAMGKAVRVTGLAAASFAAAACSIKPQQKQPTEQPEILQGDIELADSTESEFVQPNEDSAWIAGGKRLTEEEMLPTAGKPAPDAVAPTKNSKKEETPLNEEDEIELVAPDVTRCRPLAGVIARPRLEGEDEEEANAPDDSAAVSDEIVYLEEGDAEEPPFTVVEQMPEYPGGEEELFAYMGNSFHYPVLASEERMEGRAVLTCVIDKTGEVTDVEVVESSGWPLLDKEAVRVVREMPNWKPGTQRGKPVRVKYTIPFNIKLTE